MLEVTPAEALLRRFAEADDSGGLPWADQLDSASRRRLRADLLLLLEEPLHSGEQVDWREIEDTLREYAGLAEWDGAVLPGEPSAPAEWRVDVRPQELRRLERASPAARAAAREALEGFLARNPTDVALLSRGRLKKLANRGVFQLELPDGFRLRYLLDPGPRVVRVVYLGPHPDGAESGREEWWKAQVRSRRPGDDT